MTSRSRKKLSTGLDLRPFDSESGYLNVVIDTPKGSRNKFKYCLPQEGTPDAPLGAASAPSPPPRSGRRRHTLADWEPAPRGRFQPRTAPHFV